MTHFQRVLVSCDFSPPSLAALEQGARIAEATGAELNLLHVLPEKAKAGDLPQQRAEALHRLEQSLSPERVLKLTTKFLVREGSPSREIVNAARELTVDLVVMGTRGRSGIAHLALGSVAETVLRTASCPVMTVRAVAEAADSQPPAAGPVVLDDDLEVSPAVDLLRRAFALRATDVHLDPIDEDQYLIRMRIDGKLEEYCRLERGLALRQLHQFDLLARLDTNNTFRPKEGRVRSLATLPGVEVRLTVSPVSGGPSAAIRISARTHVALPVENLGLPVVDQSKVTAMLRKGEGIILVTGPTGSGKTTTVYAMLNQLASAQRNIVSIEDPVEYVVPYVRQLEVDERHELTMTAGLKTLLRMDPDVIFVGEIRDKEAAEIAMRAASSGRHVLSTLHTRDVASTITALRDLHVEAASVSANLSGVINQRLVRRLCQACRVERDSTETERAIFTAEGIESPSKLFQATGCEACRQRGYMGRVGVFEVAQITPTISEEIIRGASEAAIRDLLRVEGVLTLKAGALQKVTEGITSLEEVESLHWA